jgi:hypothetical protein
LIKLPTVLVTKRFNQKADYEEPIQVVQEFDPQLKFVTFTVHRDPTGRWFSPGIPVSSTNNTDRNDITELLLKMA